MLWGFSFPVQQLELAMTPTEMARAVLQKHNIRGVSATTLAMAAQELHGVVTDFSLRESLRFLAELKDAGQGSPFHLTAQALRMAAPQTVR
jgi:hypothetical protein